MALLHTKLHNLSGSQPVKDQLKTIFSLHSSQKIIYRLEQERIIQYCSSFINFSICTTALWGRCHVFEAINHVLKLVVWMRTDEIMFITFEAQQRYLKFNVFCTSVLSQYSRSIFLNQQTNHVVNKIRLPIIYVIVFTCLGTPKIIDYFLFLLNMNNL